MIMPLDTTRPDTQIELFLICNFCLVVLNGVVKILTKVTIQKVIYQDIMKKCKCCYQIDSLDFLWYLRMDHGIITLWVS